MTLYLVRHADAKSRSGWHGPDVARPLTKKGERQASGLAAALGGADLRVLQSSPAVRCVDTLAPLAAGLGVDVAVTDALMEGADPAEAMDLLVAGIRRRHGTVLCTHGDIIPELLRRLARDGVPLRGGDRWAKGSTWELAVVGGEVVSGRYHPPPGEGG